TITDQIVQTPEGDVEIRFNPQRSFRIPRSISSRYSTCSDFHTAPTELSRASSFCTTPHDLSRPSTSTSTSQIREETVEEIRLSNNQIPQGIYQDNTPNRRTSPTQSDMSFQI
ncbi:hypothetical protein A2U01_0062705, partial [Trifolium medium]|nr:hypothetical protein [Trifolium medium]